jgi:hypothetical protein
VRPAGRGINYRRVFSAAGLAALAIIYAVLWLRMIADPVERTGADFIAFYAAGRIALTGDTAAVFDLQAQQAAEEAVLGFPILPEELAPFMHPPFILPALMLVALLPYVGAFHAWALLLLVLYFVCAWLLVRTIPGGKKDAALFAGIVLFFPAFVSILNGQNSALLVLGAALWLYGLLKGDDRLAGIGLALTTIRPHIAILLAVPFLFNRRRVWWWFAAGAAALVVFSVVLVGIDGTQNFLHILTISAGGEGYKINEFAMVNFLGMLRRLFPGIPSGTARLAAWIVYAAALVALCVVWRRSGEIGERQAGLAVLVTLFAAPHLHYHDLALLLVPIFCWLGLLIRRGLLTVRAAALLPLAVSWLLVVSNFLPALKFSIPYIFGLALAIALWRPEIFFRSKEAQP